MSKNNPLVSIMIPVFNRQDYVGEAITSVLRQTYQNFELIVHDDASTDASLAVIKSFHDPRLRIIHTSKNHGMLGGWNYLLQKGQGKYIKQMGSDDLLAPDCIARELAILEQYPGVSLVTCQRQVIGRAGEHLFTYQFGQHSQLVSGTEHAHWILTNLRENKIGEPCAVLFRRSLVGLPRRSEAKAGLFDPQFSQFADFEYWIRLLQFGDLYYLHTPLVYFRQHPDSNTSAAISDGRFITEIFALIVKYYKDPFFVKTFSLTSADQAQVTRQKTLDTLKNIKDLLLNGHFLMASRYTTKLIGAMVKSHQ